jgi:hypothetical protein
MMVVGLVLVAAAVAALFFQIPKETKAAGTTYYVSSSSGNDANNGTSQSTPWRTMAEVSNTTFQPGDTILLKRGDVWLADPLVVSSSGTATNPITYGAYGTGNKPVLDGQFIPICVLNTDILW